MFSRRTKTYYKYLFSYIALLCLGILVCAFFFQGYLVSVLQEEVMRSRENTLSQTALALDAELEQIYRIDYQLTSADVNFHNYFSAEDTPLRDLRVMNALANAISSTTFIADVAMVTPGGPYVYAASGVNTPSLYFAGIIGYAGWEEPVADIAATTRRTVRPAEQAADGRYVTFINPPSIFSNFPGTTLLFLVKESQFTAILGAAEGMDIVLMDTAGQVIAGSTALSPQALAEAVGQMAPTGREAVRLDGKRTLLFTHASAVPGFAYAMHMPYETAVAPLRNVQLLFYAVLGIALLLGVILIFYTMRMTYQPIRRLSAYTEQLVSGPGGDELETLRDVLDHLSTENRHLNAQLRQGESLHMLRDSLLFALLKRKFDSFAAFNEAGAPLGIAFTQPHYAVLMLRAVESEPGEGIPLEHVGEALRACLSGFDILYRDLFEQIVCLVGLPEGAGLAEALARLPQAFVRVCGVPFTVGVSPVYSRIEDIATAAFEASLAQRESFMRGTAAVIPYGDIAQSLSLAEYPAAELDQLRLALLSQDDAQFRALLERLFARVRGSRMPSLVARNLCVGIVHMIITHRGASTARQAASTLLELDYFQTLEDYYAFIVGLMEPDAAQDRAAADTLLEQIHAYAAEHFDSHNFSIQAMAAQLGVNSSYMSQYYKLQTGATLLDYTTALRIRKAQTLLETTTMPLAMVSESIGYYNLNSFIRRFKQVTGQTPGEYRKAHHHPA